MDSNSQLVVDGDDNGKFRFEKVKHFIANFECSIRFTSRSLLLGMEWMFKRRYFQMFDLKLYKYK